MQYLAFYLLLFILLIDNPWKKIQVKPHTRKLVEWVLLFTGIFHGLAQWSAGKNNLVLVSGILLYGFIFTFLGAKEHKGIEDKVARRSFKTLVWFLLFIVSFIHVLYQI